MAITMRRGAEVLRVREDRATIARLAEDGYRPTSRGVWRRARKSIPRPGPTPATNPRTIERNERRAEERAVGSGGIGPRGRSYRRRLAAARRRTGR